METTHLDASLSEHTDAGAEVIAVSTHPTYGSVAKLIRVDGKLRCVCPYLCLATCEPCEFEGKYDRDGHLIQVE